MKKIFNYSFLLCGSLLLSNCQIEGCTSGQAINYDSEATKDIGSCIYESNIAFWMDNSEYLELTLMGVNTLKIYIDNQAVGNLPVEDFRDEEPSCFDDKTVSTKQTFGGSSTHQVEIEIRDQNEQLLTEKRLTITAGACHVEQMVF